MGAWGNAPFDNDTAADYAYTVRSAETPAARTNVLRATMRLLVLGQPALQLRPLGSEAGVVYEMDYRVEQAIAAAAFVADGVRGECHHTDNAFARGVSEKDDDTLNPPAELEPVDDALWTLAMATVDWLEHRLVMDEAGAELSVELAKLKDDLRRYEPTD